MTYKYVHVCDFKLKIKLNLLWSISSCLNDIN